MRLIPGNKRILVVSPHPDDSDFGSAGTIARLAREGHAIEELIISDGSKGSHKTGFGGKKLARIRQEEQKRSAAVLGVERVHFLGETDGELENTRTLRKKLVREFRRVGPDIVLSFDPSSIHFENMYRSHRDHRMAAEAVFDALYPATGNISFFPELIREGFKAHQVQEIWFFATPKPDRWVDVADTFPLKIQALVCHESQIWEAKDLEKRMRLRAQEQGKKKKLKLAETFRTLPLG